MPETAIGHGTRGSYECMPGSKHTVRANQLDGLRCGSLLREPGGLKEGVVHVWSHRGKELTRITPEQLRCDGDGIVFRSEFPAQLIPADPTGKWSCSTFTLHGQLVGMRRLQVLTRSGLTEDPPIGRTGQGSAAGSGSASGSGSAAGSGSATR